jgi:hypothetical protein
MVNTLLGKPNQNLNNFKFDLEVNPRIFYGEPQILLMQVHWHLDVIRSFLFKSIQVFKPFKYMEFTFQLNLTRNGSLICNSNSIPNFEKFQ